LKINNSLTKNYSNGVDVVRDGGGKEAKRDGAARR
jgi:hypothetical protein